MSRLNEVESEMRAEAESSNPPAPVSNGAKQPDHGSAESNTNQTKAGPQDRSSLDRVEEFMDKVGHQVGSVTSKIGQRLFLFAAHLREAAEDCWAEAQSIRRGEHKDEPKSPNESNSPPSP